MLNDKIDFATTTSSTQQGRSEIPGFSANC